MSSERMALSAASSVASPPPVSPEPAFIAASAASQIVTSDHQDQMESWIGAGNDDVAANTGMVMPAALAQINGFLDQLLYGILATARSTSIAALRPAVSEILKPRLAKDAINGADEELQDFASGREDEDLSTQNSGTDFSGVSDLNLIWRRTRLRCMVYTRLGDLEEEDEEAYIEREYQEDADNRHHRSIEDLSAQDLELVSPPSAIFLTSILEFIGEQSLLIAGDAAYSRFHSRKPHAPHNNDERVLVEDTDVEKIAFDTRLGRLWRSWKKKVRSPGIVSPRLTSRESIRGYAASSSASNPTSRKASISEVDDSEHRADLVTRRSVAQVMEEPTEPLDELPNPQDIPLPQSPAEENPFRNVLAKSIQRDSDRPSSMIEYATNRPAFPAVLDNDDRAPVHRLHHQRSISMPTPRTGEFSFQGREDFHTPKATSDASIATGLRREALNKAGQTAEREIKQEDEEDRQEGEAADHRSAAVHTGITTTTMYGGAVFSGTLKANGVDPMPMASGMSKADFGPQVPASTGNNESPKKFVDDGLRGDGEEARIEPKDPSHISVRSDYHLPEETHIVDARRDNYDLPFQDRNERAVHQNGEIGIDFHQREENDMPSFDGMPPEQSIPVPKALHTHIAGPRFEQSSSGKETATSNGNTYNGNFPPRGPHYSQADRSLNVEPSNKESQRIDHEEPQKEANNVGKTDGDATKAPNGVPPLTPLRELMEAAHDTSDEASSSAPSQDTSKYEGYASDRYHDGDRPRAGSSALPIFSNAKPASNFSDLKKQLPPVATGVERATVQRVPPSPLSARESTTPLGRISTSSNRELRTIHTSSSSASQKTKILVGREPEETPRKPLVPRHSSDGSDGRLSEKISFTMSRSGDPQRDFDQLIKSDETVKFTLTPQNMRDMESGSPRQNSHKRTGTQDLADFIRNSGPEESEGGRPSMSRSIITAKDSSGVRSSQVNPLKAVASGLAGAESSKPKTSIQRSAPRSPKNNSESTRDFADFLRSTGPQSVSPGQLVNLVSSTRASKSPSEQLPSKKITKPSPASTAKRVNSQTKKTGLRLQAREPTTQNETTFDLAEFIRKGPAGKGGDDNRIRNTAKSSGAGRGLSEQQRHVSGQARDGISSIASSESNQNSSVFAQSVHSINSRTGLLDSPRSHAAQHGAQPAQLSRKPARGDQPPQPVRKQRRIKDPYAIDTESEQDSDVDDQNDMDLGADPDSLVNVFHSIDGSHAASTSIPSTDPDIPKPPSKGPETPQKFQYPSNRDRTAAARIPPSNANQRTTPGVNAGSIVAFVSPETRVSSRNAGPHPEPANKVSPISARGRGSSMQAPQIPPIGGNSKDGFAPRATSPHLISSGYTSKLDQYRPTTATYAAHMDTKKRSPRSEQNEGQGYFRAANRLARAEREDQGGTSELADFLKNSGPPEQGKIIGFAATEEPKEKGGFSRIFGRKKNK